MRQNILTTIFILLSFTNLSYAKSENEIQRDLYESLNKKNQDREVNPTANSSNWPSTELSSAVSALFTQFGDKFNIYLWRDAKDNVWVKIEPTDGELFICGAAFDIFQNGTFRLQDDGQSIVKFELPDGTSFCGDVSETAIYKLTAWSFVTDNADITEPFVLFHNGDIPEDRESFLSLNTSNIFDSSLNKSNTLFDFAEITYPQFFSPSKMGTSKIQGYWARYYSDTDTYLGTLGDDVYVYGKVFGGLLYVGKISDFIQESNDSGNTFIINTDDKENINPFILITDSGAINIPYIVRDSNGSPSSGYGVRYITNNGEEWNSIFNSLTGELQSINYSDALGSIKISFTNYTTDLKQVDILVDYGNDKTDSIKGLSTLSLGLFLDSMTSYRKAGSTVDTGNLANELNDFEGWVKAYLHEHIEKVINWANIIGLSFEGLNHRFDNFLNKAQEDSSRITKDIVDRVTCIDEECVINEVKENLYVNGSSSENDKDLPTEDNGCNGLFPSRGDYSYKCETLSAGRLEATQYTKGLGQSGRMVLKENGEIDYFIDEYCGITHFDCPISLEFYKPSCDEGTCKVWEYKWVSDEYIWTYRDSPPSYKQLGRARLNEIDVTQYRTCYFFPGVDSDTCNHFEFTTQPKNGIEYFLARIYSNIERNLQNYLEQNLEADFSTTFYCYNDAEVISIRARNHSEALENEEFQQCISTIEDRSTKFISNYHGYDIPNWK